MAKPPKPSAVFMTKGGSRKTPTRRGFGATSGSAASTADEPQANKNKARTSDVLIGISVLLRDSKANPNTLSGSLGKVLGRFCFMVFAPALGWGAVSPTEPGNWLAPAARLRAESPHLRKSGHTCSCRRPNPPGRY